MDGTPIGFEFNRHPAALGRQEFPSEVYLVDSTIRSLQSGVSGSCHSGADLVDIGVALGELGVRELIINVTWRDGLETLTGLRQRGVTTKLVATFRARRDDSDRLVRASADAGADEVCVESVSDAAHFRALARAAHDCGVLISHGFAEAYTYEEVVGLVRTGTELGCQSQSFHDSFFRLAVSPEAIQLFVRSVLKDVPAAPPLYVHLSNFFGQATMTAVAALAAGATAVDVCANGSGHHCGHTSLAEVAVVLEALYGRSTGIKLEQLNAVSRLLQERTHIPILPWQPVVGDFAFMGDAEYWAAEADLPHDERIHATFPIAPELVGSEEKIVWSDRTLTPATIARRAESLGAGHVSEEYVSGVQAKLTDALDSDDEFPRWLEDKSFNELIGPGSPDSA